MVKIQCRSNLQYASEVLGETSGEIRGKKEGWWWNSHVQEAVKTKKEAKKIWDKSQVEAN